MALWKKLSDSRETGEALLCDVLHELVVDDSQLDAFPPEAADILLGLLDDPHEEPQVYLLTCILVGRLSNLTSMARNHLAQRGALSSLASVLKRCYSALAYMSSSADRAKLYQVVVKFVMSMLHYFSLGAPVCISKLLQHDSFIALLSAVDCSTSGMYVCGSAQTKTRLEQLVLGRSMVGRRVWAASAVGSVYARLLGCDLVDIVGGVVELLPRSDSFVVDLYDTDGDDDVHIVDELMTSTGGVLESGVCSYDEDSESIDEGDWVDVYVTCVLDGAHFVAVFGAERIEQFHRLSESVAAAFVNQSSRLTDLPSPGQLIAVSHPQLGSFRAVVVCAESSEEILTFAPDCGYVEHVPLSYLSMFDDSFSSVIFPSPCLLHVCKLMGQYPLCLFTIVNICLTCIHLDFFVSEVVVLSILWLVFVYFD